MSILDDLLTLAQAGYGRMRLTDIDPRYGSRKADADRLANLEVGRESFGNQAITPIRAEDLEGRGIIATMADRTAAGGRITDINDVELQTPIGLYGGQGYPLDNPGRAWASDRGVVTGLLNKANVLKAKTGKNPVLAPFRMAPTGNDFATKTGGVMLSYAQSNMKKGQKRSLNSAIKKVFPDWKGIDDPDAIRQFETMKPGQRKQIQQIMDRDFRDAGGLSLPEARLAVSDARQAGAPDLSVMNFIEIDPTAPRTASRNPSYSDSVAGRYLGTAQGETNVLDLVPTYTQGRGITDFNQLSGAQKANEAYSLRQTSPMDIITEQVLEQLTKRGTVRDVGGAAIGGATIMDALDQLGQDLTIEGLLGLINPGMAFMAPGQAGEGSDFVPYSQRDAFVR